MGVVDWGIRHFHGFELSTLGAGLAAEGVEHKIFDMTQPGSPDLERCRTLGHKMGQALQQQKPK